MTTPPDPAAHAAGTTPAQAAALEIACAITPSRFPGNKPLKDIDTRMVYLKVLPIIRRHCQLPAPTPRKIAEGDLTSAAQKLVDRIALWKRGVAESVEVLAVADEVRAALADSPVPPTVAPQAGAHFTAEKVKAALAGPCVSDAPMTEGANTMMCHDCRRPVANCICFEESRKQIIATPVPPAVSGVLREAELLIGGSHLCSKGHGWVANGQPCYLCEREHQAALAKERNDYLAKLVKSHADAEGLRKRVGELQGEQDNFTKACAKHNVTDPEKADLPRLYRWCSDSLASFRAKFNVASNCGALDAIEALRTRAETAERGRDDLHEKVAGLRGLDMINEAIIDQLRLDLASARKDGERMQAEVDAYRDGKNGEYGDRVRSKQ